ncbi:hypothetical protein G6F56_013577 [Rhizopus delemar]|nr:hypothetical protein G6F56_013577 [Rhizopus delemar]
MTPGWSRNYSKLSQPNALRRMPSHTAEETEEYDEDKGAEEDFGDFESANNEQQSFETITNHMETLDVNKKELDKAEKKQESETDKK